MAVNNLGGKLLLFAVSTKLREAKTKRSEFLQILLILASWENKIFFETLLLMQEKQLVKLLSLKLKSNIYHTHE